MHDVHARTWCWDTPNSWRNTITRLVTGGKPAWCKYPHFVFLWSAAVFSPVLSPPSHYLCLRILHPRHWCNYWTRMNLPFAEQRELRPCNTLGDKYWWWGLVGVGGFVRLGTDVVIHEGVSSLLLSVRSSGEDAGISLVTRTSIPTVCAIQLIDRKINNRTISTIDVCFDKTHTTDFGSSNDSTELCESTIQTFKSFTTKQHSWEYL